MDQFIAELLSGNITSWGFLLLLCIIVIFGILRLLKKYGVKLNSLRKVELPGGIKAEFSSGKKDPIRKTEVSPHKNCPNVKDIYLIIVKATKTVSKITRIEIHEIISAQMSYAEQKLILIRDTMVKSFMKEIQKTFVEDERVSSNVHYKNYLIAWRLLVYEILQNIKVNFLSGSLLSIERDEEFTNQIDEMVKRIIDRVSEFFDDVYTGDKIISRQRLQEIHKINLAVLSDFVHDICKKGREIQKEREEEVRSLDLELDEFVISKIGETI